MFRPFVALTGSSIKSHRTIQMGFIGPTRVTPPKPRCSVSSWAERDCAESSRLCGREARPASAVRRKPVRAGGSVVEQLGAEPLGDPVSARIREMHAVGSRIVNVAEPLGELSPRTHVSEEVDDTK